jgi:hypothetical protein
MTDTEVFETTTQDPPVNLASEPIYKKWHKTGFISVGYWAKASKFTIEIGSLGQDGSLKSPTKCFVPVYQMLAYLHAEVNSQVVNVYPKFDLEGYSFYGGGKSPTGGVVSRVFKITNWKDKVGNVDKSGRAFKCGHFAGQTTTSGAITPILSEMISSDVIKMTVSDLAEIYQICSLAVIHERPQNQ